MTTFFDKRGLPTRCRFSDWFVKDNDDNCTTIRDNLTGDEATFPEWAPDKAIRDWKRKQKRKLTTTKQVRSK